MRLRTNDNILLGPHLSYIDFLIVHQKLQVSQNLKNQVLQPNNYHRNASWDCFPNATYHTRLGLRFSISILLIFLFYPKSFKCHKLAHSRCVNRKRRLHFIPVQITPQSQLYHLCIPAGEIDKSYSKLIIFQFCYKD